MVKDDFLNKKKSLLLALLLHFQQQAYHFESLGIYIGVSFQRRIKFMEFQFCPGRHLIAKKDNFCCCFFYRKIWFQRHQHFLRWPNDLQNDLNEWGVIFTCDQVLDLLL